MTSNQYIVRLDHYAASGDTYTAFHGPYPTFSGACRAGDELAERYVTEPMRLDGSQCRTECSAVTLMAPPSITSVAAKQRADWCSCGRRAVQVLDGGDWGPTGYCGTAQPPLEPCDCPRSELSAHDRTVCHVYGAGMATGVQA